jgi:hypothetical protein
MIGHYTIMPWSLVFLYHITLFMLHYVTYEARSNVVAWDIMVQNRKPRVRYPMKSLIIFNLPNHCSRTMALGLTQPIRKWVPVIFLGGGAGTSGWKPHRNLWPNYVENVGSSTSHNPVGFQGLLQRHLFLLNVILHYITLRSASVHTKIIAGIARNRPIILCPHWSECFSNGT